MKKMKKTILRITLAAGLVGVANWAMSDDNKVNASEVSATKASSVQVLYTFVSGHPLAGQQRTAQEIEDQNLCPGQSLDCATAEGEAPILWSGNETKF